MGVIAGLSHSLLIPPQMGERNLLTDGFGGRNWVFITQYLPLPFPWELPTHSVLPWWGAAQPGPASCVSSPGTPTALSYILRHPLSSKGIHHLHQLLFGLTSQSVHQLRQREEALFIGSMLNSKSQLWSQIVCVLPLTTKQILGCRIKARYIPPRQEQDPCLGPRETSRDAPGWHSERWGWREGEDGVDCGQ